MNVQSEELVSKKEAILRSVLELIKENGFHGVPMSQVAKNAGVAAGTIYHYFPGKDAIITELCGLIKSQMAEAMFNESHTGKEYKHRFFVGWIDLCRYFINNPSSLNFIEQYNSSPYAKKDTCKKISTFGEKFNEFFRHGIDSGIVKPIDQNLITSIVFGCIISTAKFHLSGRYDYTDADLCKIANIIWDGIKVQE